MFLKQIHIENYRNYNNFTMSFQKGLNVIIGANNSGKTGLLRAITLINNPSVVGLDDFNKNNLLKYSELYMETAPSIVIEYFIEHIIDEDDTDDESIIKLLPFLGVSELEKNREEIDGKVKYTLTAQVKMTYSLDEKHSQEYCNAVKEEATDFHSYFLLLKRFVEQYYSWQYTNGMSETKAEGKVASSIFDIRFIGAERTSEEVRKETRQEIVRFIKSEKNAASINQFRKETSEALENLLKPSIEILSGLFEKEDNTIGLKKGNVAITSNVQAEFSIADSYITEVLDTKSNFALPLQNNGLGYNNLINIYMLIKLSEAKKGKDFRILCLEEPEAHLHPAMQYKLFKFLKDLDEKDELNQQIIVTTHSSNISAVAGLDNMYMLAYERNTDPCDCVQQSLSSQFISDNVDEQARKAIAKKHLSKFLDVTRSDLLFADKIILVEGLAEKLLMPKFMELCGCSFEDEHISIVEVGGKLFNYFVELFNRNQVVKKVLCITDNDYTWIDFNDEGKLESWDDYLANDPTHIKDLKTDFPIPNLMISTQRQGGRTFEDEFFLQNLRANADIAKKMFALVACDAVQDFVEKYGFVISDWKSHINDMDGRSKKVVNRYIKAFDERKDTNPDNSNMYEGIIFSELFLQYAKEKKGDVALNVLTNDELVGGNTTIVVPEYIKEGLEWLLR